MSQNLELKNLCATKKTSVDFLVAEDPSYSRNMFGLETDIKPFLRKIGTMSTYAYSHAKV